MSRQILYFDSTWPSKFCADLLCKQRINALFPRTDSDRLKIHEKKGGAQGKVDGSGFGSRMEGERTGEQRSRLFPMSRSGE